MKSTKKFNEFYGVDKVFHTLSRIKKHILYKSLENTVKSIKKNYLWLILSFFMDGLFLIFFSMVFVYINTSLMKNLYEIFTLLTPIELGSIAIKGLSGLTSLVNVFAGNPKFFVHYDAIIDMIILFLSSSYIFWCFFQGISWWVCERTANIKESFIKYIFKFFIINILWFSAIYSLFFLYVTVLFNLNLSFGAVFGKMFVDIIAFILLSLISYFMFISYAIIPNKNLFDVFKQTFILSWKYKIEILLMYLILAIPLWIIYYLTYLSYFKSIELTAVVIFFIFIPSVFFAKVYMCTFLNGIKD